MRKVVLLLLLGAAVAFVYKDRERIFVRDVLGSVSRNGVKEGGAQVFVNFSNDVLLENDRPPMYLLLLQHGQPVNAPARLPCIHYLVCLLGADAAAQRIVEPGAQIESMSAKELDFRDSEGRQVVVRLH